MAYLWWWWLVLATVPRVSYINGNVSVELLLHARQWNVLAVIEAICLRVDIMTELWDGSTMSYGFIAKWCSMFRKICFREFLDLLKINLDVFHPTLHLQTFLSSNDVDSKKANDMRRIRTQNIYSCTAKILQQFRWHFINIFFLQLQLV